MLAPIALFAYNRPWHIRQTVEALATNDLAAQSDLLVFCDGAKSLADQDDVSAVQEYVASIGGFRTVQIVTRPENWGLARSIIAGVTETIHRHGTVIVLEDDLVTSPHFLTFMNHGLEVYADEKRVACIHGYVYPADQPLPETFFLRGADCWGWATWRRAWEKFRPNADELLAELRARGLERAFDLEGNAHFTDMLLNQVAGRINSWAIRWHASAFLADMLTLYPGRPLVRNIGIDGTGTHCGIRNVYDSPLSATPIQIVRQPLAVDAVAARAFGRFLKSRTSHKPNLFARLADLLLRRSGPAKERTR